MKSEIENLHDLWVSEISAGTEKMQILVSYSKFRLKTVTQAYYEVTENMSYSIFVTFFSIPPFVLLSFVKNNNDKKA